MNIYVWNNEWLPGENTIAYYPLTSTSTVNDMKTSGTKYNLTNYNNVQFWTYHWVDCANFSGNSMILYNSSNPSISWDFTLNVRCWVNNTSSTVQRVLQIWQFAGQNIYIWVANWYIDWTNLTVSPGQRNNIIYSRSWSSLWLYVNSNWITVSNTVNWTWLYIGRSDGNQFSFYWNISEAIIEDKARTAKEVQNYYNSTKANYWIQ